MGTAAAGGGGCGARRWLPWLGLCFWAAGAAAARGKRWVDRGAQRSGRRRSGTRTFGVGFPSCACFSPRAERDSVGTGWRSSRGPLPSHPSLLSASILQVVVTRAPTLESQYLFGFPNPPYLLQAG